jgi:uncharacterized membrane protein (UPF0127 family)
MNKLLRIAFLMLVLAVGVAGGTSRSQADTRAMILPTDPTPLIVVADDGSKKQFSIEIADNPDERAKGLMFRSPLEPDHGMLFVFPYTREVSFWMENTPQPLDLVFVKEDGRVATVMHGKAYSRAIIDPGVPVRYVLELGAGVARSAGIHGGTLVIHPAMGNSGSTGSN